MFIRTTPQVGDKIRLEEQVELLSGHFTAGSILTITGFSDRGMDLVDESGNKLLEFGHLPGQYTLLKPNE